MGDVLNLSFEEQERIAEDYDKQKLIYEDNLSNSLEAFFISGKN